MNSKFITLGTDIGDIEFECFYTIENDTFTHEFGTEYSNDYRELQTFEICEDCDIEGVHEFVKEHIILITNELTNEINED